MIPPAPAANDRGVSATDLPNNAVADAFRLAMRELATAVCIVTAGCGHKRCGLTASSVTSLSLSPPSLLVSIQKKSRTLTRILEGGVFAVNILAATQRDIGADFAGYGLREGLGRFADPAWIDGRSGVPVLTTSLGAVECRVVHTVAWHTHVVVFGLVSHVHGQERRDPLIYWRGGYRDVVPSGSNRES